MYSFVIFTKNYAMKTIWCRLYVFVEYRLLYISLYNICYMLFLYEYFYILTVKHK